MRDMDKQPLATSASNDHAESAEVALQHIVNGFMHFRHEVFPAAARAVQETRHRAVAAGDVHHLRRLAHRSRTDHPQLAGRPVRDS
jgi:hypothetical protein